MGQYIFGKYDPRLVGDSKKTLLKSSLYKTEDYISQGYEPRTGGDGVLYTWRNTPIAFWDVPTLNRMVFSKELWEALLSNEYLKASLESKSHWGEASHADRDEMLFKEVAIRVTDFRIADNNLVLGDVDLMDTPNGLTIYACAKTGRAGNSSRGFGELSDRPDGLREVVVSEYTHIGWDAVTFPAVPDAHMTVADERAFAVKELGGMSDRLRSMIRDAHERHPDDLGLSNLWNSLGGETRKSFNVNALRSTLIAHEVKKRYSTLQSGRRGAIMSMAGVKFNRMDAIRNLLSRVPELLSRRFNVEVFWDSSSPIVDAGLSKSGRFLKWNTTFSFNGVKKSVLFTEDSDGVLFIDVDGKRVIGPFKMGRFDAVMLEHLYRSLT
jgi:hypothetical protein